MVSGSTIRSKLNLTASALSGVPSWNLTPGFSLKVQTSPSGLDVQDSASPGNTWPSARSDTSGSKMFSMMKWLTDCEVTCGSRMSTKLDE